MARKKNDSIFRNLSCRDSFPVLHNDKLGGMPFRANFYSETFLWRPHVPDLSLDLTLKSTVLYVRTCIAGSLQYAIHTDGLRHVLHAFYS